IVVAIGAQNFEHFGDITGDAIANAIDGGGRSCLQCDEIGCIANGRKRLFVIEADKAHLVRKREKKCRQGRKEKRSHKRGLCRNRFCSSKKIFFYKMASYVSRQIKGSPYPSLSNHSRRRQFSCSLISTSQNGSSHCRFR